MAIANIGQNIIDDILWTNDPLEMLGINMVGIQDRIAEFDFDEFQDLYYDDPVGFMEDILFFDAEPYQEEIAESVRDFKRTSVVSGQGVGKTAVVACIIIWYICTRHNAKIIATAPSMNQIYTVLWSEIAKWLKGTFIESFLTHTKTKLYMIGHDDTWFAQARTASSKEGIAGLHDENMLIVVDEASGVKDDILETLLGTITEKENRLLWISNGTKSHGLFFDSHHRDRSRFNCVSINAEKCKRVDHENIEMLAEKYGRDSNAYRVRVRGLFPKQEADVLINIDDMERAVYADFDPKEPVLSIDIGVDVARFGTDKTIVATKLNNRILPLLKRQGQDTMQTAQQVLFLAQRMRDRYGFEGTVVVKVDDTGVGGGVTDRLKQLKAELKLSWLKVTPAHFGLKIKHAYYEDSTSYMMGLLKDMISQTDEDGNPKETDLILPNDPDLIAQATIRKYKLSSKSRIQVESKKEMKKRLGDESSPDELDAVLLAILPAKR